MQMLRKYWMQEQILWFPVQAYLRETSEKKYRRIYGDIKES